MQKILTLTQLIDLLKSMCEQSTQKEVAEKLGVSQAYLGDVIRGHRMPGEKILEGLRLRKREQTYERIDTR